LINESKRKQSNSTQLNSIEIGVNKGKWIAQKETNKLQRHLRKQT